MKLSELTRQLSAQGIENARGEAMMLFRHFAEFPEHVLRLDDPDFDSPPFRDAIARRLTREPLQYILGECAFYDEVYRVTPAVLIPRSDTELLVETALSLLKKGDSFLDLCTGSGCIAISMLRHSEDTHATLVDLSPDARAVARENVMRYELSSRATLVPCDVLRALPEGEFDLICSNPPYIPEDVYKTLAPEIFSEPKMAFVASEDGMAFYRAILSNGRKHLKKGGAFVFEIGFDQGEKMLRLAEELGFVATIQKDFGANDRVAVVRESP